MKPSRRPERFDLRLWLAGALAFVAGVALAVLLVRRLGRARRACIRAGRARGPGRPALPTVPAMPHRPPQYEPRDARASGVVAVGCGLLVVLGLVVAAATALQYAYVGYGPSLIAPPVVAPGAPVPLPTPPVLAASPRQELEALHAQEDTLLHTYGWVDPARGVVRLPIERAMALVAERGLPVVWGR